MRIDEILNKNNKLFERDQIVSNREDTYFYKAHGDTPLYHSSKDREKEGFVEFSFRKAPRDSFMPFHNEVNRLAKQKLGLPIRSLLFAMADRQGAANFNMTGVPYAVYPVSEGFRLFYSHNTGDMTEELHTVNSHIDAHLTYEVNEEIREIYRSREDGDDRNIIDMTVRSMSKVIRNVFMSDNRRSTTKGLELFFEDVDNDVMAYMSGQRFTDSEREQVSSTITRIRTQYQNLAYEYVGSIVEASSPDELPSDKEIMVYDPYGFFFQK